jgi:hypothetical protein
MKTSLSLYYNNKLNLKTYIKISIVAIIIYVLVLSKQLPQAKANDVIQIANCDSDLDQADTIYQLTDNIVGNCTITANNITIDGQFQFNITGNVLGHALNEGQNGFDFTLQNLGVVGSVFSIGFYSLGDGGNGGNINIINSNIFGQINLSGGTSGTATGGNGGTVNFFDSIITEDVSASGGYSYTENSGNGGFVELNNSIVSGKIIVFGGSSYNGVFNGGDGGVVSLTNSSASGNIDAFGGNSILGTGSNGGTVTLTNSTSGQILAYGGYSTSETAGNAGSVTLTNSTSGNIRAFGGYSYSETAGNGGNIILINSNTSGQILAYGGQSNSGTSGNGGEVTIEDSFVTGNINTLGGDGPTPGTIGELTITDNPPILTTPSSTEIEFNEVFDLEQDLSAIDIKDGDLTNEIQITGIVGEEAGEYEIEYEVSDLGTIVTLNGDVVTSDPAINTVTANITITRLALPEQPTQTRRTTGSTGNRDNQSVITEDSTIQDVKIQITSQERQGLIEQLRSKLQTIFDSKTQTNSGLIFTRNLDIHDTGDDVRTLQQFLISKGYSIPDGATGYFGFQTWIALRQYQIDNDIIPASGYFGPVTRGFVENN